MQYLLATRVHAIATTPCKACWNYCQQTRMNMFNCLSDCNILVVRPDEQLNLDLIGYLKKKKLKNTCPFPYRSGFLDLVI